MRIEHRVVHFDRWLDHISTEREAQFLDGETREGWRLCAVAFDSQFAKTRYYFSREVPDPEPYR